MRHRRALERACLDEAEILDAGVATWQQHQHHRASEREQLYSVQCIYQSIYLLSRELLIDEIITSTSSSVSSRFRLGMSYLNIVIDLSLVLATTFIRSFASSRSHPNRLCHSYSHSLALSHSWVNYKVTMTLMVQATIAAAARPCINSLIRART